MPPARFPGHPEPRQEAGQQKQQTDCKNHVPSLRARFHRPVMDGKTSVSDPCILAGPPRDRVTSRSAQSARAVARRTRKTGTECGSVPTSSPFCLGRAVLAAPTASPNGPVRAPAQPGVLSDSKNRPESGIPLHRPESTVESEYPRGEKHWLGWKEKGGGGKKWRAFSCCYPRECNSPMLGNWSVGLLDGRLRALPERWPKGQTSRPARKKEEQLKRTPASWHWQ
ncbi:hypothetical protein C8Q69DRAFT_447237 [Paecilomyces variotii]|uniref:Uncharacterized protein n=1 Tax=Byssochlamys spectabilis TaxID=264951 RepID=A0A443HL70_BYSSP|nr:hypothetical protein C8Q69DRAFT_447237 [Paecilomyces variotii]RWQ92557.1 hypothetical protein C8Q69DRAFT_447237 [Paecilomyces variotii]